MHCHDVLANKSFSILQNLEYTFKLLILTDNFACDFRYLFLIFLYLYLTYVTYHIQQILPEIKKCDVAKK